MSAPDPKHVERWKQHIDDGEIGSLYVVTPETLASKDDVVIYRKRPDGRLQPYRYPFQDEDRYTASAEVLAERCVMSRNDTVIIMGVPDHLLEKVLTAMRGNVDRAWRDAQRQSGRRVEA